MLLTPWYGRVRERLGLRTSGKLQIVLISNINSKCRNYESGHMYFDYHRCDVHHASGSGAERKILARFWL